MKSLIAPVKSFIAIIAFSAFIFGQPQTVEISAVKANIRQAATTKSNIIATVKRGDKLQADRNDGSWYHVTKGNITGWLHYSVVRDGKNFSRLDDLGKSNETTPNQSKFNSREVAEEFLKDSWQKVVTDAYGSYSLNRAKCAIRDKLIACWIQYNITSKVGYKASLSLPDSDPIDSKMNMWEVDCNRRQFRLTESVSYNVFGEAIAHHRFDAEEMQNPLPDSVGDGILEAICRAKL